MPLANVFKELRFKMASLQSPRTQCCCCAVGVFAAMFGIFMLTAGICILLNVSIMEVDTSGLPPDLQNDDGKTVVGIILVVMAVVALGLSSSVSMIYFFFCGRKDEQRQEGRKDGQNQGSQERQRSTHGSGGSLSNGGKRNRPTSRDSGKSMNSLHSLSGRKVVTSPDGTLSAPTMSRGVPSSGYKGGSHHRKHKGNRKLRPNKHRASLPTHTEEEMESGRSIPDLKLTTGRSAFYVDNYKGSDGLDGESYQQNIDARTNLSTKNPPPPRIVVDSDQASELNTVYSIDETLTETTFVEGVENQRYGHDGDEEDNIRNPFPTDGDSGNNTLDSDVTQTELMTLTKLLSETETPTHKPKQPSTHPAPTFSSENTDLSDLSNPSQSNASSETTVQYEERMMNHNNNSRDNNNAGIQYVDQPNNYKSVVNIQPLVAHSHLPRNVVEDLNMDNLSLDSEFSSVSQHRHQRDVPEIPNLINNSEESQQPTPADIKSDVHADIKGGTGKGGTAKSSTGNPARSDQASAQGSRSSLNSGLSTDDADTAEIRAVHQKMKEYL